MSLLLNFEWKALGREVGRALLRVVFLASDVVLREFPTDPAGHWMTLHQSRFSTCGRGPIPIVISAHRLGQTRVKEGRWMMIAPVEHFGRLLRRTCRKRRSKRFVSPPGMRGFFATPSPSVVCPRRYAGCLVAGFAPEVFHSDPLA